MHLQLNGNQHTLDLTVILCCNNIRQFLSKLHSVVIVPDEIKEAYVPQDGSDVKEDAAPEEKYPQAGEGRAKFPS